MSLLAMNSVSSAAETADDGSYKIGSFKLNPAFTITEYFDDNIFYTRNDQVDDFITLYSPSLSLRSDWKEHELNLSVGSTVGRYDDNGNEDYEDYFAGVDGHYDFSKKTRVFGGVQYNDLHEGRDDPDDVFGLEPTEYDLLDLYAGGQHDFGQYQARFGITLQDYDFDDVAATAGLINNDDRDRKEYELGLRVSRLWGKIGRGFLQTVFSKREYDLALDDNGFNRESDGVGVSVGLQFSPIKNLNAEIQAGYLWQNYDDANLEDVNVPDFGALVSWRPSRLTKFDLSVDRRVRETTLANASSYVSTYGHASVEHYMSSDLIFNTGFSFTENDYEGVGRTDEVISFDVGNRYYFNPQIFAGLSYQFIHRDSDQAGEDFFDNRVFLNLGMHLDKHKSPLGALAANWGKLGSFYLGAQGGHGSTSTALNGQRGPGTLTADFSDHGGTAGLFAGYDHMFGQWFLGLELEAETSDMDWNHINTTGRIFSVKREESYGVSLRGGYKQENNVNYYVRMGMVSTNFDEDYFTSSGTDIGIDEAVTGFKFGGGLEAPLISASTFVRMDYAYTTYTDNSVTTPGGSTDNFDNSDTIMRIGIGYRMGANSDNIDNNNNHEFQGAYAGTNLGYGVLASRNDGPRTAPALLSADRGSHGSIVGLFGGYGLELNSFYVGVEGDGELSYTDWNIDRDPNGRVYDIQKDWTIGGAVRAGYIFNGSTLVYGRVGAVLSEFSTHYAEGTNNISQDDTLGGIRFGGGLEVAATENVFVRMDYTYTDYEDFDVNYVTAVDSFENTETLMRVGVGYRF